MQSDTIVCRDCLDVLPTIPDQSIDAVITDPPYPCIERDYGYWTVEEWWELIVEGVIPEVRRILKPTGSAVFILQPNSEHVGQMRGWLWEFMAWVCREWNMVQDVWWWNHTTMPNAISIQGHLLRTSVKACVWCGDSICYRNQKNILWSEAKETRARRFSNRQDARCGFRTTPSGQNVNRETMNAAVLRRGGVSPFNLLPFANTSNRGVEHSGNHGGATPLKLADWWTRYIVPSGGMVVDPFMGSGAMAVAAIKNYCHFFGCDTVQDYVDIANERIAKAKMEMAQMEMAL